MSNNITEYKVKMSFICPCYNDGESIERFVDSVLDQDFTNFEIIIVNDGSTDNTKDMIDAIAQKDKRIKVLHLPKNKGACMARNLGAVKAQGEYYSFLPADSFMYPGVLRTWIEQLDEYPDYDFLFGGYRFVDKELNQIPGLDFLFNPFDPYLLETTNYIDGSFPIRAKCFWDMTKLMNEAGKQKSEGLWDPAIKSLQDWDFWLTVVKEGKRKGLYIQDIFFETLMPHEGGLSFDSSSNWLERTDQIKAKHDIPIRRLCVGSLGATFHAKRMAYLLNADFLEMPSRRPHHYDAIYVIGFYPEFAKAQDAMFLNDYYHDDQGRTATKKIVHFIGTDIWQLRKISLDGLEIWKSYLRNGVDEVLVEADFTQKELFEILGIEAKIVPLPPAQLFDIMPLSEKFTVACYQPQINAAFYRGDLMEQVAKMMPDVEFKFYGNPMQLGRHKDLKNIEYAGYISDMGAFIKECSAIMRFPFHDGLPISVCEFVLAGRYAVLNVPMKDCYLVPNSDVNSIVEGIRTIEQRIKKEGVNKVGSDYWRVVLDHDKYRKTMAEICGYDPKSYWEQRAISWNNQADTSTIEEKEIKKFYNLVKPKTLLDLGCGNGRWIPILEKWGLKLKNYQGIDISGKLIEIAQAKYPQLKKHQLFMEKVENMPIMETPYDLIFCYTTLEHIKEEDIEKAVIQIKKCGRKLLLIEPTDFESRYYCRNHNYAKLFKVIKKKKLADKTIYLIDLEYAKV